MKIVLFIFYIHLTFCFYEQNKLVYEAIRNFDNLYSYLIKEYNKINNIKSDSEKEKYKYDLINLINNIIRIINNKDKINKLKKFLVFNCSYFDNTLKSKKIISNDISIIIYDYIEDNLEKINDILQYKIFNETIINKLFPSYDIIDKWSELGQKFLNVVINNTV